MKRYHPETDAHVAEFGPNMCVDLCRCFENQAHQNGEAIGLLREELARCHLSLAAARTQLREEQELDELDPYDLIYFQWRHDLAHENLKLPQYRQPVKSYGDRIEEYKAKQR